MKECKYCGSQCGDQVVKCPSCGGTKFFTAQEQIEEERRQQKERENEERAVAEPDTGKKRIGGIIAGLLAVILIIVAVIIGLSNRPLSNGMSKSDGDEILESGIAYYESGNYEAAIECFIQLPSDSKQYAKASDMLASARAEYKESALSKVNNYIQQENYDSAFNVIETATLLVGNDSDLNAAYEEVYTELVSSMLATADSYVENSDYEIALEYLSNCQNRFPDDFDLENAYNDTFNEYCSLVKSDSISTADEAASNEDYVTAINALRNAISIIGQDEEVSAKLSIFESSYQEYVLSQAGSAFASDGYSAAIDILNGGLTTLSGNNLLLDAIAGYEEYKPVYILDLTPVDTGADGELTVIDNVIGIDGTEYGVGISGKHFDGIGSLRYWNKYLINSQYSTLSFRVVLTSVQYKDYQTPSISIYGDDNQLLRTITVSKNDIAPVDVSVDVSGQAYLKIDMDVYNWDNYTYVAAIVDARLEK